MNTERLFAVMLGAGLVAALLWRFTPAHAAPVDTATNAVKDMAGVGSVQPLRPAEAVVGMSYTTEDRTDGPALYTVNYPGERPGMPPAPSLVKW